MFDAGVNDLSASREYRTRPSFCETTTLMGSAIDAVAKTAIAHAEAPSRRERNRSR